MKLYDKSEPIILVEYHKIGAYSLFNLTNKKIVISRHIMIDANYSRDWNYGDEIDKPLMSYGFDEAGNEVEVN